MCDRVMMSNYLESLSDEDLKQTCEAAVSGGGLTTNCQCWTGLDQDWLNENFDCKWEQNDVQTLLEQYNMYCMNDGTCTYPFQKSQFSIYSNIPPR